MIRVFLIILSLGILYSCHQSTIEERLIQATIEKSINISSFDTIYNFKQVYSFSELNVNYDFITLVYLEEGCTSCYNEFQKWSKAINLYKSLDNCTVVFIFHGNSYDQFIDGMLEFNSNYDFIENNYFFIFDKDQLFINDNPNISRWIINKSITIDSLNKVKFVGYPFASVDMTKLFKKIINR